MLGAFTKGLFGGAQAYADIADEWQRYKQEKMRTQTMRDELAAAKAVGEYDAAQERALAQPSSVSGGAGAGAQPGTAGSSGTTDPQSGAAGQTQRVEPTGGFKSLLDDPKLKALGGPATLLPTAPRNPRESYPTEPVNRNAVPDMTPFAQSGRDEAHSPGAPYMTAAEREAQRTETALDQPGPLTHAAKAVGGALARGYEGLSGFPQPYRARTPDGRVVTMSGDLPLPPGYTRLPDTPAGNPTTVTRGSALPTPPAPTVGALPAARTAAPRYLPRASNPTAPQSNGGPASQGPTMAQPSALGPIGRFLGHFDPWQYFLGR